jgi:hypothetical protein
MRYVRPAVQSWNLACIASVLAHRITFVRTRFGVDGHGYESFRESRVWRRELRISGNKPLQVFETVRQPGPVALITAHTCLQIQHVRCLVHRTRYYLPDRRYIVAQRSRRCVCVFLLTRDRQAILTSYICDQRVVPFGTSMSSTETRSNFPDLFSESRTKGRQRQSDVQYRELRVASPWAVQKMTLHSGRCAIKWTTSWVSAPAK